MQYLFLGKTEMEASVIGLGTWAMGGEMWGGTDESASIAAVHASLDAGINFIDTAPVYGYGLAEELLGKALAGKRHQVIIASKCGLVWNSTSGTYFFSGNSGPVHRFLGPESIQEEVETSLRRLQTDHIDLYQTHWQESTTPIADTMACLLKLKDQGKIGAIGVSNVTLEQLSNYLAHGPITSVQERYSMLDRELEADLFPFCAQHQISVLAYSPLSMGLLTGRMGLGRTFEPNDLRATSPRFVPAVISRVQEFLAQIQPLADQREVTVAQLVLAWTFHQPHVTHVLCGARNPRQALQNAEAGRLHLTTEELQAIDERLFAAHLLIPPAFGEIDPTKE